MARGYGLGWVTSDRRGQWLLWHSGGTFGFSTQAALLPDADLGLVVLTNGINASFFTDAVQFRLFELAFGQPVAFDAVVTAGIAAAAQRGAEVGGQLGPVDPQAVAPYPGRFESDVLGEVEVALDDGSLFLDAGDFRAELRPLPGAGGGHLPDAGSPVGGAGERSVPAGRHYPTPDVHGRDDRRRVRLRLPQRGHRGVAAAGLAGAPVHRPPDGGVPAMRRPSVCRARSRRLCRGTSDIGYPRPARPRTGARQRSPRWCPVQCC